MKISTAYYTDTSHQVWKIEISDAEMVEMELSEADKKIIDLSFSAKATPAMMIEGLALIARRIEAGLKDGKVHQK